MLTSVTQYGFIIHVGLGGYSGVASATPLSITYGLLWSPLVPYNERIPGVTLESECTCILTLPAHTDLHVSLNRTERRKPRR